MTDDGYAVYNSPNAVPADKTYYVKELEAPKGYERSTEILQLKDSGEKNASGQKIYRAEYTELPGNDPINIILKKQAAGLVDGSYDPAELAGAQYRMEYFDGYYYSEYELNAAIQGGVKPLRTWVFKTDNRGFISYKEESKVYMVTDYGFASSEQLPTDFYSNDIRIVVCGGNAEEVATLTTLSHQLYRDESIIYIFSFIDPDDRPEVLDLMGDRREMVHFAPYTPDCFRSYEESGTLYRELLGFREEQTVKPKRGFGRKRRR